MMALLIVEFVISDSFGWRSAVLIKPEEQRRIYWTMVSVNTRPSVAGAGGSQFAVRPLKWHNYCALGAWGLRHRFFFDNREVEPLRARCAFEFGRKRSLLMTLNADSCNPAGSAAYLPEIICSTAQ